MPIDKNKQKREQRIALIQELEELTDKNVLVYYALSASTNPAAKLSIQGKENEELKNCLGGVGGTKGMILLLRTPGGNSDEAEKMIATLRDKSNQDLTVIVIEEALSAGTVITCSANKIIMGPYASLGPIDLQIWSSSMASLVYEIDIIMENVRANPNMADFYMLSLKKYKSAILSKLGNNAENRKILNGNDYTQWQELLQKLRRILDEEISSRKKRQISLFGTARSMDKQPEEIIDTLYDKQFSFTHQRRFDRDTCRKIGLAVEDLEDIPNSEIQRLVLDLNQAYMDLFAKDSFIKIIETRKHTKTWKTNNRAEFV